jgi:hypothetical protein
MVKIEYPKMEFSKPTTFLSQFGLLVFLGMERENGQVQKSYFSDFQVHLNWSTWAPNDTTHFFVKSYRGKLWKDKENKNYKEKIEGNSDGVKLFMFIKLQMHLVIVKID